MKIAIEGCCHGELDAIYAELARLEQQNGYSVDLLLICGDFQAIRNHRDLACMAVPDKYKKLGGFAKYYTGDAKAPILTLVIGGNHEASNYFWELYHGGWIAHNIYYLGHANCVQVNGVRIGGASGIFKPGDFHLGHYERPPYNHGSMRSIYHIREYNIRRLSLLSPLTIFLSHDWPQGIAHHGDLRDLLRRKPYFRDDINKGVLGSPPMMDLLHTLHPAWWFAAHLHCRFEATVEHRSPGAAQAQQAAASAEKTNPDEINIDDEDEDAPAVAVVAPAIASTVVEKAPEVPRNPDEITMSDEEDEVEAPPPPPPPPVTTRFLALDKCLPRRKFLEVIDVDAPSPSPGPPLLTYDPEWLAITRAFNPHMSTERHQKGYPDESPARAAVADALEWVRAHVPAGGAPRVEDVQQFVMVAPGPAADEPRAPPPYYPNPQTAAFCAMLQIENKVDFPPAVGSS
ncbi:DBR1-domain-containing protein [Trametes versicolor FP-101664 SS1]|uniref:DBR1-domain-containing protein n=1 Tax=Trametes versicolor (strain FP-101664) TaxID=717944 RepID=UPI0004621356|nr:DBR1-domain-containing protein [Trametes versicolor FP-101664 SS1]EIW61118.1 DBR1-domain-containing protein [Trametes versicolor FP-101664 SS1]